MPPTPCAIAGSAEHITMATTTEARDKKQWIPIPLLIIDVDPQLDNSAALDAVRQQIARPERGTAGRNGCRVQQVIKVDSWLERSTSHPECLSQAGVELIQARKPSCRARVHC